MRDISLIFHVRIYPSACETSSKYAQVCGSEHPIHKKVNIHHDFKAILNYYNYAQFHQSLSVDTFKVHYPSHLEG